MNRRPLEPARDRPTHQPDVARNTELIHQGRFVGMHGLVRDAQLVRDFVLAQLGHQQEQHLALARREIFQKGLTGVHTEGVTSRAWSYRPNTRFLRIKNA